MNTVFASYGPWGVVGILVVTIVTAFAKKLVVPWGVLEMVRLQQQQITDLHKARADVEAARNDVLQRDLVKLMEALPDALRKPAVS